MQNRLCSRQIEKHSAGPKMNWSVDHPGSSQHHDNGQHLIQYVHAYAKLAGATERRALRLTLAEWWWHPCQTDRNPQIYITKTVQVRV